MQVTPKLHLDPPVPVPVTKTYSIHFEGLTAEEYATIRRCLKSGLKECRPGDSHQTLFKALRAVRGLFGTLPYWDNRHSPSYPVDYDKTQHALINA